MIITQSAGAVQGSFWSLWYTLGMFLPAIIAAFIWFLIGWVIGVALYHVVVEVVKALRINEALKATGLNEAAERAGFRLDVGKFLGTLVEWFVILVFLVAALDILGLSSVTVFLEQVILLFLPRVIVAALMIIIGAIAAEVVRGLVTHSARAVGAHGANLAGTVSKWAIMVFAILAALAQLGIGTDLIMTLFQGLVIAFALSFGLAFGLGGKDAAARAIERVRSQISHHS
ncbi:MAG TPA: hypothetical protein VN495_04045 [Candidatus Paceibacterota bacterium]|nr:hypothetical protein [Candidatus Paceibacterota bacterium]